MRTSVLAVAMLLSLACSTPEPQPQTKTSSAPSATPPTASAIASSAPSAAAPDDAPAPDPTPVLEALAAGLAKARAAKADESFTLKELPKVDALVGQTRDAIERALGKPSTCKGNGNPAPCQAADDVFYSLYKLPTGSVGGGPELLLSYDDDAFCSRAQLLHTQ